MFSLNSVSRERLKLLYPYVGEGYIKLAGKFYDKFGMALNLASGLRTWNEQDLLFLQGRSLPGSIVTHAKGGESEHNYGLAFDVSFRGKDPYLDHLPKAKRAFYWAKVGEIGKSVGLEWGGDWPEPKTDFPHFQYTGGLPIPVLRTLYQSTQTLEHVWLALDEKRGILK